MSFTYNLATSIGKVRLQIPDTINSDTEGSIFSDEELQAFLDMDGVAGNVLRAAAYACGVIGRDESLIQKVQKIKDIETNGAELSKEFRAHAQWLMAEAKRAEEVAVNTDGGFEFVNLNGGRRCR